MENLVSEEEEQKGEKDTDDAWMKQFETKTSFVLKDSQKVSYNFSLESVL
jgi:hypothetical protein